MRLTTRLFLVGAMAVLAIAISAGSASATISNFTVDPKGTLADGGTHVTVSGTVTCLEGDSVTVFVGLSQVVGRLSRGASTSTSIFCTGTTQPWSVTLSAIVVLPFVPGRAALNAQAADFTDFSPPAFVNRAIVLTR